jgi:uncharacterized protein
MRQMKRLLPVIFLYALALLTFNACRKKDSATPDPEFDRKAMLVNIADSVIIPSYASLNAAMEELSDAVQKYSATPGETEAGNIRAAFIKAYRKWQYCSIFEFGPGETELLRNNLNIHPTDTAKINSNISGGEYNLQSVSNFSAKGFPALDFLLYRRASAHQYFSDPSLGSSRLKYLRDVTAEMRTKVSNVNSSWKTYRAAFVGSTGTEAGSSTALLVNQINQNLDNIKNNKVGIPLGKKTLGQVRPQDSEALYSGLSTELLSESLKSMEQVYTGKKGLGFDDYLDKLSAKNSAGNSLNAAIKGQFSTIFNSVSLLGTPIPDAVVNKKTETDKVYSELVKLLVYTKTDMASALSVSITYQDNDGD